MLILEWRCNNVSAIPTNRLLRIWACSGSRGCVIHFPGVVAACLSSGQCWISPEAKSFVLFIIPVISNTGAHITFHSDFFLQPRGEFSEKAGEFSQPLEIKDCVKSMFVKKVYHKNKISVFFIMMRYLH